MSLSETCVFLFNKIIKIFITDTLYENSKFEEIIKDEDVDRSHVFYPHNRHLIANEVIYCNRWIGDKSIVKCAETLRRDVSRYAVSWKQNKEKCKSSPLISLQEGHYERQVRTTNRRRSR